jgi:hypothetical protein
MSTGDIELYAAWGNSNYTLTFSPASCSPISVAAGSAWGATCDQSKLPSSLFELGTFGGWYTGSNCTGTKITSSSIANGNVTAYVCINYYDASFSCNNDAYSWSNVSGKVDLIGTGVKSFYYKRAALTSYSYGSPTVDNTSKPAIQKFTITDAYHRLNVYAINGAGVETSVQDCYTKFDVYPNRTPIVVEVLPAVGSEDVLNIKSMSFECDDDDTASFEPRTCTTSIERLNSSRDVVYDRLRVKSWENVSNDYSGVSPHHILRFRYFYKDNQPSCVDNRIWDGEDFSDPSCSVKNVDYREITYIDEAGNETAVLTVNNVWIN